jgi:hypothetical protein
LSASEIGLRDTCFGRELKRQKREMEAAIEHFSLEDRNVMRRRLDEIDDEEALTMALEEAPTEETNAGEWQCVLIRGVLYVNILVTNHIIVYLSSQHWSQEKSQKKALWRVP